MRLWTRWSRKAKPEPPPPDISNTSLDEAIHNAWAVAQKQFASGHVMVKDPLHGEVWYPAGSDGNKWSGWRLFRRLQSDPDFSLDASIEIGYRERTINPQVRAGEPINMEGDLPIS